MIENQFGSPHNGHHRDKPFKKLWHKQLYLNWNTIKMSLKILYAKNHHVCSILNVFKHMIWAMQEAPNYCLLSEGSEMRFCLNFSPDKVHE